MKRINNTAKASSTIPISTEAAAARLKPSSLRVAPNYVELLRSAGCANLAAGHPSVAENMLAEASAGYETRLRGAGGGMEKVILTVT